MTGSSVENTLYGFVDAKMVRNSRLKKISGDALQNSKLVVNVYVENMNGSILEHHSDLLQYFGHFENVIVMNVFASKIRNVQNIFLDHYKSSFTDVAFVNIAVENLNGNPPFSQLNAKHNHVLFFHVSTPMQQWVIRDDFDGEAKFEAHNVVIANSIFYKMARGNYHAVGVPEGIKMESNHFVTGSRHGNNATSGRVDISFEDAYVFDYIGPDSAKIGESGKLIPKLHIPTWKYGSENLPNRGAFPIK